jgi:hypothetical protein
MRQHHTKVHGEQLPNSQCKNCGEEFFRKSGGKYCDDCKDDRYRGANNPNYKGAKEEAVCTKCGDEFRYYPSAKSGNICSECWEKNTSESTRGNTETMCTYCGDSFTHDPVFNDELPYCDEKCLENDYSFESQINNSKDKGDISESKVISFLSEKGFDVSVPFGDNTRYDLVLDVKDTLLRVQVKTGNDKRGVIKFRTNSVVKKSGNQQETESYDGDADVFAVYCQDTNEIYWIPVDEAPNNKMTLRYEEPKHRLSKINYVGQYTFDRGIGRTLKYID